MTRVARLILALIVGLAVLTFAASGVVESTVRQWAERDMEARAQLVLTGAGPALADAWYDPISLSRLLYALDGDERVIGASACGDDFSTRSVTGDFPRAFSCLDVGPRVRDVESSTNSRKPRYWSIVATLPTGLALVSAMPVTANGRSLGFAILVHDLSYIDRREKRAQTFLLSVFGLLALMAFGIPLLVNRRARQEWRLQTLRPPGMMV